MCVSRKSRATSVMHAHTEVRPRVGPTEVHALQLTPPHTTLTAHTGVANLVQKGYKKISPFFIPYAITNMGGALLAIDQVCAAPLCCGSVASSTSRAPGLCAHSPNRPDQRSRMRWRTHA